ncbi:MAG: hypothetical protein WA633_17880 [Stellaceae bacterium]
MSMGIGIPGDFRHDKIAGAHEAVIATCRSHGKWPGMAGFMSRS